MAKRIKKLLVYALAYALAILPGVAYALPTGGQVVAGSATIQQPDLSTTVVNQQTDKAIINWDSFSIGSGELVNFNQPSSSSVVLNRVVGVDPSVILGNLTSNGRIFLVNPSGVIFGAGARVDVGGILATTLKISDQDFLQGNYHLMQDSAKPLATILNEGHITANAGTVGLLAPAVENRGTILASLGSVAIGAGTEATVDFSGDGLINFAVTTPVVGDVIDKDGNIVKSLISNTGTINADGGLISLQARDASNVIRNVVNNSGIIEAKSVVNKNGKIILSGGTKGIVRNEGTIDASGRNNNETGGTIQILGENVALSGNAVVDVAGVEGGGTILIGGDYQGKNPDISNAKRTYVGNNVSILADATSTGNGGKVIVWADDVTRYYGNISAIGGILSGNGGFTEVSGKRYLDFQGNVDLAAENGTGGTLLLDPTNITITTVDANITGFNGTTDTQEFWTDDPGASSTFNVATLEAVAANSTIQLMATGDISVNTALNITNSNVILELDARNNLNVNANISTTGMLFLYADEDLNGGGTLAIANGITLTSTSSFVKLQAGIPGGGQTIAALGTLNVNAANGISLIQSLVAGGAVAMNADTDGNGGAFDLSATMTLNAQANALSITADTMNLNGTLTGSSTLLLQPSADATTIGIAGGTGTFALTAAEIGRITNGFSSITIGRTTGTGAVDQNTVTFNDPLTIRGGAMVMDNLNMGANNLTLSSSSTIDGVNAVTSITTTGTLTLTSNGEIGGINVLNTDVGTVTVNSSGGNNVFITDQGTSDTIYNISTGGAGDLMLIQTASNMVLGTSAFSTTGNLFALSVAGTITDGSALTVGGTASFTADTAAQSITLNNANAITGAVSFTTTGTGDVTFDNGTTAVNLGTVNAGRNLTVTSGGTITQSGALNVSGTGTFVTDVANQNITLSNTSNSITGNLAFTTSGTGSVIFDNGSTIANLGTSNVGGNLTINSSGGIVQNGVLTVGGVQTLNDTSAAVQQAAQQQNQQIQQATTSSFIQDFTQQTTTPSGC